MPSNPRLAALPAFRKLAEEEARAYLAALYDVPPAVQVIHGTTPDAVLRRTVEAHLALLSDLSRPASRDAVARLVAEAVGLTCGATAPDLLRVFPEWWEIRASRRLGRPWEMTFCEAADVASDPPGLRGHKVAVPGISAVTDPTEALTLIALAVLS